MNCLSGLGACFHGLDELIHGHVRDLGEIIADQDERELHRWLGRVIVKGAGNKTLVEALDLVCRQGDIDATTPEGTTALHEAVAQEQAQIVAELIAAGAAVTLKDNTGRTPVDIAVDGSNDEIMNVLIQAADDEKSHGFMNTMRFFAKVKVFKSLHPEDIPKLAAAFKSLTYHDGERIVSQGDTGKSLFVIESGHACVQVLPPGRRSLLGAQKVQELGPGDYFGEDGFLTGEKRAASVVAQGPVRCEVIDRTTFDKLHLQNGKLAFKKRKAVQATYDPGIVVHDDLKAKDEVTKLFIKDVIRENYSLGPFFDMLTEEERDMVVQSAHFVDIEAEKEVIRQGDIKADLFYVIETGKFNVWVDGKHVSTLWAGDSFGEKALLYRVPRVATVVAAQKATCWAITRQELRTVVQARSKKEMEKREMLLGKIDIFKDVTAEERKILADALTEMSFLKDEYVIEEGVMGTEFYVLYQGDVDVEKDGKKVSSLSGCKEEKEKGHAAATVSMEVPYFGEKSLLEQEPCDISVRAVSDTAVCLVLDRSTFEKVVKKPTNAFSRQVSPASDPGMIKYSRANLKTLGLLGCGGFGVVTLVEDTATKNKFALKALSKGHIVQNHQQDSVVNEKAILKMTRSPFLVQLAATFASDEQLFFLLEAVLGGELQTVYHREELAGSEKHAKFYVACAFRALKHLHDNFVMYRDLKPENLLMDNKGYCKLTDFGLAKFVMGPSYTTCGTPDYFAPEMIAGSGHNKSVDWWTLGVFAFELMTGTTPFSAHDNVHIFQKVQRGIDFVHFPTDGPWVDFVQRMLVTEPRERLPMRPGLAKNVEAHPWYQNFSWRDLDRCTMTAPYLPAVVSLDNFCADSDNMPPQIPYEDPGTNWEAEFEDPMGPAHFRSFDRVII
eukprot:gnl/TRDRNA2_/TRDRNA2_174803_c10_seq8.p1 gnl/TRDRNA2_/TRDRNA2_174803_c10~~gnl/TRDRNA2_/TRDRNA2_174803_c10_seq8.p1  ORF type:complete len:895 (-),score=174.93 gnl/TRDRNA2_/TRDRNA2_174803_c10_seq8:215-2899(-)